MYQYIITTYAGNGNNGFGGDGFAATSASLSNPTYVAVDLSGGNLYFADSSNWVVRKVTHSTGIVTTYAGSHGSYGYSGDGFPATSAHLSWPAGLAVAVNGDVFIADSGSNVVRLVTYFTGIITTYAGTGNVNSYGGDGGPAKSAYLSNPTGVAVDVSGNLYIADTGNSAIRFVTNEGIITTIAGNGNYGHGYDGDGLAASSAYLNYPYGVAVDVSGNLFIADSGNSVIRLVSSAGIITTYAGNGIYYGGSSDGAAATSTSLCNPQGVTVDTHGNLYIADQCNSVIRIVSSAGSINTYAGTLNTWNSGGDGGPATLGYLNSPSGVSIDGMGRLFIADQYNQVIRMVNNTRLLACSLGNYVSSGICTPCPVGTYQTNASISACNRCPMNTYSSVVGASMCTACPSGLVTGSVGASSIANCVCPINTYSSFAVSGTVCTACPKGSTNYVQGATACTKVT